MFFKPNPRRNKTIFSFFSSLSQSSSELKQYNFKPPLSLSQSSSKLKQYNFRPPLSFTKEHHPTTNPNPFPSPSSSKKPKKEPFRPPSSLDQANLKTLHSDLPFDFRYSYTESSPSVKPIGLREPKYSPFGPGRLDRVWTGLRAPAKDPIVRSVEGGEGTDDAAERARRLREKILGEPLTDAERKIIVERNQRHRSKRQVNLGRDGLTHNMLNDIHNHWKNAEAVRIKCLGVPTVDMNNVCTQLEDKTGGLVIHRKGGTVILYRGRYYNPKKRPVIPLMLWKPHEPIYPRLIKTVIDGLSIEETKEMRKRGLAVPALTKLAKNGYYGNLLTMVRDAFLTDELVRIDCKGVEKSDYRKIGLKLRDLVPCVLVTFDKEQIVIWKGKNYTSADSQAINDNSVFDFERLGSNSEGDGNGGSSQQSSDDELLSRILKC